MTEDKSNVVPLRPKEEVAPVDPSEMTEEQLVLAGYVPVTNSPDYYSYNYEGIQTIEDVQRFVKAMDIHITTMGDQTLESLGRDPADWIKIELENDTSTDI
jgi:hypothetical protein